MAITRKPTKADEQGAGVDVDALINKGGSAAQTQDASADDDEEAAFTLRVPRKLLKQVDAHRKAKPIKTPRQQFILEAMLEKLERESK